MIVCQVVLCLQEIMLMGFQVKGSGKKEKGKKSRISIMFNLAQNKASGRKY